MNQKDWWNARYRNDNKIIDKGNNAETSKILTDKLWLEDVKDFKKILYGVKKGGKVLDLGCGFGQLSQYFTHLGFNVTAVDFSENALAVLKASSPEIQTMVLDITEPLPFADCEFDIVIANLCLHYFNKKDTEAAIAEIKRVLKQAGILIGSVVSTEEWEAVKNKRTFIEVEPNFYHEIFDAGKEKHIRFYSEEDINYYFSGFEILYLQNKFKQRMGIQKGAWEFICKSLK